MPKRTFRAWVGGYTPGTPEHSLPSYEEPTPETNPKLSREQEADLALNCTSFTPRTPTLLIALFLLTIASVPVLQLVTEMRTPHNGAWLPMFDIFRSLPGSRQISTIHNARDIWNLLPHAAELKAAEKALETDSVVSQWLLPSVQSVLVGRLRAGNEQVYLGRDGWLFYRPDVDYVTGLPFLDHSRLKHRAHAAAVQADPIRAIVQFRDQLAARGIELVLLPVPTKATIEGDKLADLAQPTALLQNPSFAEWQQRLGAAGVRVFDPAPLLLQRKAATPGAPLYLETDTHWRPETMQLVAEQLAASLKISPATPTSQLEALPKEITAIGDVARMLKLPETQQTYCPQQVTIQQVTAGSGLWRPTPEADVLLLGDSFANIFSLEGLGWGESAGFAEHLSRALGGRSLDCILRNSDAAFATREMLANELARGRDRLADKKLVIWEFAARELAFGNWKLLDLKLGSLAPATFYVPLAGQQVEVTGIVEAVSSVPRPGAVPYTDHIMAAHLADVAIPNSTSTGTAQSLVYLSSMHDNIWTPAARLRPGDRVSVRLRPWTDVAPQYEQINRSEIDNPEIQLEEPAWGELVK